MKLMTALLVLLHCLSSFAIETGIVAPDFTLKSAGTKDGEVKLSNYKGKIVVLEWLNHGCPFVRKHYDSGNMQALQSKYVSKNVIWLSVISSAPGKQGFVTADEAREDMVKNKSGANNVLLDPTGEVGQLYGAKTTPHMFIIDKEGVLVYQGAIDDKADANKDSIAGAKNYVAEALDLTLANKKVSQATTKAYGCGVKYK
jgi:peroxiredoxin